MLRFWTVLLLIGSATVSGRAPAQPLQQRCKPDRISAQIAETHRIPSLRGCRVEDASAGLGMQDYSLKVEARRDSDSIGEGRIVGQRVPDDSSYVYVTVSTGPSHQQQPAGGHYGDGGGGGGGGVGQAIVGGLIGVLTHLPPPNPPPQPPVYQPPPPPADEPPPVYQPPQPPPQQVTPPPVPAGQPSPAPQPQPTPQPAPPVVVVDPPKPAPVPVAEKPVEKPKTQLAQVDKTPPAKDDAVTSVTKDNAPAPAATEPGPNLYDTSLTEDIQPPNEASTTPSVSNDAAPISNIGANTVSSEKEADGPATDARPWWQKLLDGITSSPALIAALAAAAVVAAGAGAAKFLFPRATCSIDGGSVSLGAPAPKSRWPSLTVDTVLGDPLFSIARPLPMGRRTDAPEPSPA